MSRVYNRHAYSYARPNDDSMQCPVSLSIVSQPSFCHAQSTYFVSCRCRSKFAWGCDLNHVYRDPSDNKVFRLSMVIDEFLWSFNINLYSYSCVNVLKDSSKFGDGLWNSKLHSRFYCCWRSCGHATTFFPD